MADAFSIDEEGWLTDARRIASPNCDERPAGVRIDLAVVHCISLPEGQYATTRDGHKMHFHAIGEGSPVLWLHGSGPGASGWSNFKANAEALAEHGYQSILVDSIGYGLSDKPTDVNYGLGFMADCAADVMAELGHETYAIVGNSQGGAQAIWIALNHPERVQKLILMAPGGLEERKLNRSGPPSGPVPDPPPPCSRRNYFAKSKPLFRNLNCRSALLRPPG